MVSAGVWFESVNSRFLLRMAGMVARKVNLSPHIP